MPSTPFYSACSRVLPDWVRVSPSGFSRVGWGGPATFGRAGSSSWSRGSELCDLGVRVPLADLLRQLDDDSRRAADVAELIDVFVVLHLANELTAAGSHGGDGGVDVARTLEVAGEPWSPLIIRDVWVGLTRFDEIQGDLGISRKVLTERLRWLVAQGVLLPSRGVLQESIPVGNDCL